MYIYKYIYIYIHIDPGCVCIYIYTHTYIPFAMQNNVLSCHVVSFYVMSFPLGKSIFPKVSPAAPRITPVEDFDEETTAKGWRILPGEDTNCRELDQLQLELVLPAEKARGNIGGIVGEKGHDVVSLRFRGIETTVLRCLRWCSS